MSKRTELRTSGRTNLAEGGTDDKINRVMK